MADGKDEVPTNPTILPEEFLKTWTLSILIAEFKHGPHDQSWTFWGLQYEAIAR
jgi:hypothetical protein